MRWLGAVTGAIAGVCMGLAANWHMAPQPLLVQVYVVGWQGLLFACVGWIVGKGVEE